MSISSSQDQSLFFLSAFISSVISSFSCNFCFLNDSFFDTSYISISSSQDQSLFFLFTLALLILTSSGIYALFPPEYPEPDAILTSFRATFHSRNCSKIRFIHFCQNLSFDLP